MQICTDAQGEGVLLIHKFLNYFVYSGAVFYVRGCGSETERGIYHAPPVISFARSQFYYQSVVNSLFERKFAVYPCGEGLFSHACPRSIIKAVFPQGAVADLFEFGQNSAYHFHCGGFVHALRAREYADSPCFRLRQTADRRSL